MKDLHSSIGVVQHIAPAVHTATVTATGADLQGFNSAEIIINTGAVAEAGVLVPTLQESDESGSGYTDVAATDLLGTLPAELAAATAYKVGYRGSKRYIRAVLTKGTGTSVAAGVVVIKGHPADAPVA